MSRYFLALDVLLELKLAEESAISRACATISTAITHGARCMEHVVIDRNGLERILEYRNEEVITAFCDALAVERAEAETIFMEMLKFLWLCGVETERSLKTIDNPIIILDEMWHAFILFTHDYHDFSFKHFGRYLHHSPTTAAEKLAAAQEQSYQYRQNLLNVQRQRYSRIYDQLGRGTFIKWFYEFPSKYPPEKIRQLRRK